MIYHTTTPSPLGKLSLYSDGQAITAITMPAWRYTPPTEIIENDHLPVFQQAKAWLENYFTGIENLSVPPISPTGTDFQLRVWQLLTEIPRSAAVTYGDIARTLERETGCRSSARAVGGAVGRNPIAILIPCHRVIGADGTLTGFGGGMDAKRFLLDLEGIPYRESSAKKQNPQPAGRNA